jgi:hypothetical protein
MSGPGWARIVAGMQRRVVRRTRVVVMRATPTSDAIQAPDGCELVRIDQRAGSAEAQRAECAMQAVGEQRGLVQARLAHGDDFVGWQQGGDIVSFGWVRRRERCVGPMRLVDAPGRSFIYNFQTRADCRGRHLYPDLLLAVRALSGREGGCELFGEVNVHNLASARGIERAGFVAVGEIAWLTIADRWMLGATRTRRDATSACPF